MLALSTTWRRRGRAADQDDPSQGEHGVGAGCVDVKDDDLEQHPGDRDDFDGAIVAARGAAARLRPDAEEVSSR